MDIRKYEANARARGLKPVKRLKYKECVILISDGHQDKSPMCPVPHYKTEWAFGRNDEKLDIAQPLHFEMFRDTLGWSDKKDERIKQAIDEAKIFIDNCEKIEQYG